MKPPSRTEIWPPHEAFYIHSMRFNTLSAEKSISQVNAVLHVVQENSPEDPFSALPVHLILDELQNVLIKAAAVSRYFWPARSSHEWRGAQLRSAFGISDENPLRSRDLRNSIEHFDERLDLFLQGEVTGHILPEYVGPLVEPAEVPVKLFRAYYVDKGIFELLGQRFDIQPISQTILEVHEQLGAMERSGGRLRGPATQSSSRAWPPLN
jgi:hypothetical protein